jgi:hypothetical protein
MTAINTACNTIPEIDVTPLTIANTVQELDAAPSTSLNTVEELDATRLTGPNSVDPAHLTSLNSTQSNDRHRNKRTAEITDADISSRASKMLKSTQTFEGRNTRNDGRKRGSRQDANVSTTADDIHNAETVGGWDSDLTSLGNDSDRENNSRSQQAQPAKPRRRIPNSVRKQLKVWQTIDDIRKLTDQGALLLQGIFSIADPSNQIRLEGIKDILAGEGLQPDNPDTLTLEVLVKRCEQSDVAVASAKFRHMVNLMQLSLWLDQ